MDKIFGAITGDKDERPSPSSLPSGNKGPGGGSSLAGNLLGLLDNDADRDSAANDAAGRAGSSGNADMFKSVLGSLMSQKDQVAKEDIDEEDAVKKHKKYFVDDDNEPADSKGLGAAAAIQALKKFNSGEEDTKGSSNSSMGKFLSLAMAEASKLFDDKASKDKVASGTKKDDVVKQAGEMALKMFLKSQSGQPSQGGGGGASDLMGMASKFLK